MYDVLVGEGFGEIVRRWVARDENSCGVVLPDPVGLSTHITLTY